MFSRSGENVNCQLIGKRHVGGERTRRDSPSAAENDWVSRFCSAHAVLPMSKRLAVRSSIHALNAL
jgi:hypothetical protein